LNYKISSPLKEGFFLGNKNPFWGSNKSLKKDLPIFKDSLAVLVFDSETEAKAVSLRAFCLFRRLPGETLEIDYIASDPLLKRSGYGAMCVKALEESFRPLNVWLEVSELNFSAISFYESLGFVKVNVRKDYYNQGEDAFLYSLNLQKD